MNYDLIPVGSNKTHGSYPHHVGAHRRCTDQRFSPPTDHDDISARHVAARQLNILEGARQTRGTNERRTP